MKFPWLLGPWREGRARDRFIALTPLQTNDVTGTFRKVKMKAFPRSQLFAQAPRGILSTMRDAKELESRAAEVPVVAQWVKNPT